MENNKICQSCSMPLDQAALLGTEKDGSPSQEYCKYCYQQGEFTHPGLSLEEMKQRMVSMMENEKLPQDILEAAVNRLPHLKRWAAKNVDASPHP
ncbi:zinc ribbon domain-containing protein [Chitinophaga defluvii]|uniref:Zinc ribbon domain-containing protein n=1 Tax=Chitinophaga defluvii TaxID=3163343 RepID=A0ABV2T1D6_9BACT